LVLACGRSKRLGKKYTVRIKPRGNLRKHIHFGCHTPVLDNKSGFARVPNTFTRAADCKGRKPRSGKTHRSLAGGIDRCAPIGQRRDRAFDKQVSTAGTRSKKKRVRNSIDLRGPPKS